MLAWLASGVQAFKVPEETKESAEDNITKNAEEAIVIKQKKRSLNGHRLQLSNHIRDCTGKIELYKAYKTLEASDRVDQAWQKVLGLQVKSKEILDELHSLDEEEEESYIKQREELNKQVDDLAKHIEAAKQEVAADFGAE